MHDTYTIGVTWCPDTVAPIHYVQSIYDITQVQILKLMATFDDITVCSILSDHTQCLLVIHGFNLMH